MARLLTALWLLLALAVGGAAWAAEEPVAIPPLQGRVNDLTGTLSAEQRARLESALEQYERTRGSQIAILVLPTTQPEAIEQFGIRLAEAWKIGRQGIDDGVILIVAMADRRMRIEVGYGLEGVIPDAVANRIINEQMVPRFQAGDFAGGLEAAVIALTQAAAGAELPPPATARAAGGGLEGMLIPAIIAAVAIGTVLRFLLGNFLGALVTGAGTGVVGWFVTGSLALAGVAALAGIFAALFGLSLAFNVLTSGGGRGGGGLGGGGFSGGGGGFGGGGASGRW